MLFAGLDNSIICVRIFIYKRERSLYFFLSPLDIKHPMAIEF